MLVIYLFLSGVSRIGNSLMVAEAKAPIFVHDDAVLGGSGSIGYT